MRRRLKQRTGRTVALSHCTLVKKAIAKRGAPGGKDAGKWVPLEPGYVVRDDPATGELVVELNNVRVH